MPKYDNFENQHASPKPLLVEQNKPDSDTNFILVCQLSRSR